MQKRFSPAWPLVLLSGCALSAFTISPSYANDSENLGQNDNIEIVNVHASRQIQPLSVLASSLSVVDDEALQDPGIDHIAKALNRAPATWITQGSGQEHLTAIRSPVFTGAGACGNFIVAIDSIATRASGFCNLNQLFDLHYEAAEQIEITRGPSGFSHGGNALYGHINLITPNTPESQLRIQLADYDFKKLHATLTPNDQSYVSLSATDSGSFRESAGFKEQKLSLGHNGSIADWENKTRLHISNLNQETAGFIQGTDSYRDAGLRTQNANPDAYRNKRSALLYSTLTNDGADKSIQIKPYVRYNDMEFLMHFLPWQPVENNRHSSVGAQSQLTWFEINNWTLLTGFDVDYTQGELQEFQENPSPFAQNNIPQGAHYDFDVNALQYAGFISADTTVFDKLHIALQARLDNVDYQYTNNLSDGSACGPEATNCRFFRPADRDDKFTFISPSIELRMPVQERVSVYAHAKQAHRAPQATELYRLQQGQQSSDVNEETIRSVELGLRGQAQRVQWHVALFNMNRSDGIFLDSERQVVFGESSKHQGIEWEFNYRLSDNTTLFHSGTYAEHRYTNSPGGRNIAGLDMDTAPRQMNTTELSYDASSSVNLKLNYRRLGAYFLDQQNTARYPGHALVSAHASWNINQDATLTATISNLQDKLYAERADLAFGNERYFPGELQRLSIGLNIRI